MGMIEMLLTLSINVNLETTQLSTFFLRIKRVVENIGINFQKKKFVYITIKV